MLRISLIIAIVAGLAAAGLNFYKVRENLTAAMTERDNEKTLKETEQTAHRTTKKNLADTEEKLASTTKKLETTTASLKETSDKLVNSENRVAELTTTLEATTAQRNAAQQELQAYQLTGVPPEGIKKLVAEVKSLKDQAEALTGENVLLAKQNKKQEAELIYLRGESDVVPLPAGLKGRIVAVDPKYDFVVLDIGEDKGVLERGEMLINRNGKLVGKIRIAQVQPNQSIANILPAWKQDEVMEGDQVLY